MRGRRTRPRDAARVARFRRRARIPERRISAKKRQDFADAAARKALKSGSRRSGTIAAETVGLRAAGQHHDHKKPKKQRTCATCSKWGQGIEELAGRTGLERIHRHRDRRCSAAHAADGAVIPGTAICADTTRAPAISRGDHCRGRHRCCRAFRIVFFFWCLPARLRRARYGPR